MKDKKMIILTAFLTVLICLIVTVLLFYTVTPKFLVIFSFVVGIVTGVCSTVIILILKDKLRGRSQENDK